MRLTPEEVAGITTAVAEVFGPEAVVRLFGSRVRDDLKGGDIDLLVEVPPGRETFKDECALSRALEDRLGERRVDVLLVAPETDRGWITREAMEGIVLRRPEGVALPRPPRLGSFGLGGYVRGDPEKLRLARDAVRTVAQSLSLSVEEVAPAIPFTAERVARLDRPGHKDVLSLFKSFEQLQDMTAHRLMRLALAESAEDVGRMSVRDAINRMERLAGLDAARFVSATELRHALAHEYPMTDAQRAKRINEVWAAAPGLIEDALAVAAYADRLLTEGDAP